MPSISAFLGKPIFNPASFAICSVTIILPFENLTNFRVSSENLLKDSDDPSTFDRLRAILVWMLLARADSIVSFEKSIILLAALEEGE